MTDWRSERDQALLLLERSKVPAERARAAEQLQSLALDSDERWPELVEVLPRLVSDAQEEVRRLGVAMGALILDADEAEPFLISRLADKTTSVRLEATGQIADLARQTSRGALASALQDSAFLVRFEAARGMAALRHSSGLDVLAEALDRDDLRFRALGALAELGDPKAIPAIQKVYKRWFLPGFERTQAAGALAKLGDETGARHLLERAQGRWNPDRALAIELCGEVRAAGAFEPLCAILKNPQDACRGAAARGLGRLGNPEAAPLLTNTLQENGSAEDLRLDAAEGLCLLQHPSARETLEAALPTFQTEGAREELRVMLQDYL